MTGAHGSLMTVRDLARRTGLSIKAIRQYEAAGLIYSAGRSESNYRLFDESALWCAQVIVTLRSLGLTVKEIEELVGICFGRPEAPIGSHLGRLLDRAEDRIGTRIAELEAARRRIAEYRAEHAEALAGGHGAELMPPDPRRAGAA